MVLALQNVLILVMIYVVIQVVVIFALVIVVVFVRRLVRIANFHLLLVVIALELVNYIAHKPVQTAVNLMDVEVLA